MVRRIPIGRGRGIAASSDLFASAMVVLSAFLLGSACLQLGGALGGDAAWPLNGLLIAACVMRPGAARAPILVGGLIADVLARLLFTHAPLVAAGIAAGDAVEVLACLYLLDRLSPGRLDLSRSRDLKVFVGAGAVLAPLLGALVRGALLHLPVQAWGPFLHSTALPDSLGLLILAPPLLRITPDSLRELEAKLRGRRGLAPVAAVVLTLSILFSQDAYPLFFLVPPVLIYVAFTLGEAGASFAILASAAVCVALTAAGHGPIAMIGPGGDHRLAVLQVFLATISLAILPVSTALARRNRLEEELRVALEVARTNERATGEALRKSRLVQEIAGIGEWRYDPATESTVWSEQTYFIHGMPRGFAGERIQNPLDAYRPEDQDMIRAYIQRTLEQATPFEIKSRIQRGGERNPRAVVIRGEADFGPEGEVKAVTGVVRDITEEESARRQIEESEIRYRAIAENATDIITRTDLGGRLLYVSPAVEPITGFTPAELIGRPVSELIHEADADSVAALYSSVLQTGRAPAETHRFRARLKRGGEVWLEGRPTVIQDREGRPSELIDVARDISARVAVEAELRAARDAAEAAAAVKSDFMANMSHEIRTPLTAILGFTRLLGERPDLDRAARDQIRRIAGAGDALLSIVNDILDFSKLEAGQVQIDLRPTSPAELLRDALHMFGPQADLKGLSLRFAADRQLPEHLLLDPHRVRQIVLNLVGNAVKFTEAGEVALIVAYDPVVERLSVAVKDTGPGLSDLQRQRLFQRFSQGDASTTRRHGGTGLGLAISKGLAELLGGGIGVESTPGEGSTFLFWIAARSCAEPAAVEEDARSTGVLAGARVLVVDDNPVNRELTRALLEPAGAVVTEAEDGSVALEVAARLPQDLILMDLRMPGLDGHATLKALRSGDGPNRDIPVIAFSADAELDGERALSGFDGRVRKPIVPAELLRAILERLAAPDEPQLRPRLHRSALG